MSIVPNATSIPGTSPEMVAGAVAIVHAAVASRYVELSAAALLVFDYIVTFGAEVEHIWRRPRTFISWLFLTTRYLPLIDTTIILTLNQLTPDIDPRLCRSISIFQTMSYAFGFHLASGILAARTSALYDNHRGVLFTLAALILSAFGISTYLCTKLLNSLTFARNPFPPNILPGCYISKAGGNRYLEVFYIIQIILDTSMVLLVIPKAISQRTPQPSPLYYAIYTNGLRFFLYSLGVTIANIILLYHPTTGGFILLASCDRALHAILATRLVIAIRSAADYRNQFNSEYLPDISISDPETISKMFPPPPGTVGEVDEVEMSRISEHGDGPISGEITCTPTRGEDLVFGEDEESSAPQQLSSSPPRHPHTVEP